MVMALTLWAYKSQPVGYLAQVRPLKEGRMRGFNLLTVQTEGFAYTNPHFRG